MSTLVGMSLIGYVLYKLVPPSVGTFLGGILHTLPFLIPHYQVAVATAAIVVAFELVALAYLRWRFFQTSFVGSLGYVTLAGLVIAGVSAGLGVSG